MVIAMGIATAVTLLDIPLTTVKHRNTMQSNLLMNAHPSSFMSFLNVAVRGKSVLNILNSENADRW